MRRILVIDDDPDILRIIRYMLRDAGFGVVVAHNGRDGIEKAKVERPDLVLTDLAMPEVSGVEVIRALRADPQTAGIPVLAVTAHTWDPIAEEAGQAGCVGYVPKPVDAMQLRHAIDEHLQSRTNETVGPPSLAGGLRLRER